MSGDDEATAVGAKPLRRFWHSALGFWVGAGSWMPWTVMGLLVVCVIAQLLVQYRLNLWNRDFFNALEQRDGAGIRQQTYLLPALAAASIALAATAVWGRMIDGAMSLGEVTQAAAAFAAVQGAFNWLVDNYPRLAEWALSASRVGILLFALDLAPRLVPEENAARGKPIVMGSP